MEHNWFEILVAALGAFGIGNIFQDWAKRRNPTKNEKIDFAKTYTDAQIVNLQFTEHIEKLVEEKTESLRQLLVQREIEHRAQVDLYLKKIADVEYELKQERLIKEQYLKDLQAALFEISQLKQRVNELEVINKNNNN